MERITEAGENVTSIAKEKWSNASIEEIRNQILGVLDNLSANITTGLG